MKKKQYLLAAICFLTAFFLWTAAVVTVDVQPIGPEGSAVGFAGVNGFVHSFAGVHMGLYNLTDWLSLIPFLFVMRFGLLGLVQWVRRKSLWKVDRSILALGIFYLFIGAAYVFFEKCVINYRPVLIDGVLEASYPSSTTILVVSVMSTAALYWKERIRNTVLKKWMLSLIAAFTVFMVVGRLLSGVHWMTDIIGGILLSTGLVLFYAAFLQKRDCF